jgi:hypothetical protein
MKKSVLLLISLLAVSLLFEANSQAATTDLASLDWSVKAPHNLATNPVTDDQIKTFMSRLDGGISPQGICEAHFANLQHSGTLSLVVSENDGRFCHLSVVDKTNGGFNRYVFDLSLGTDGPEIQDLGGNGNLELIVPTDLTGYQGGGYCMARWPVIYAWTGNGYSDVSGQYRGYYERQLVSLQKEIATTKAQRKLAEEGSPDQNAAPAASVESGVAAGQQSAGNSSAPVLQRTVAKASGGSVGAGFASVFQPSLPMASPAPDRDGFDCTKAEAAKIERFLGTSRDAGMDDAIKLANSNNPDDREFAAWIFADIATPEAIKYLQTLSLDPAVASTGKYALEQANRGPVAHTVDEVSVP